MASSRPKKAARTSAEWTLLAQARLRALLKKAQAEPALLRRVPRRRGECPSWSVSVKLVGGPRMAGLNGRYRGKPYATDVLSFTVPRMFLEVGHLGELVICLPVMKRQARERGHAAEDELSVLLVHGVLHLLGMDHELGERQAAEMARWEARMLPRRVRGLIGRG